MPPVKTVENRWIRRYRTFFIIGTIILSFQIYLAVKFFGLYGDSQDTNTNKWNPHSINVESSDVENSVNSARRTKDGFVMDDEDNVDAANLKKVKVPPDKHKPNKSKQQSNRTNNTVLRLEELDFVPSCDINTKEAVSAIHRAKTQKCKREISNVTCLIQRGVFYPARLSGSCPTSGFETGKSLGCYKDEKSARLLTGYYGNHKSTNSPDSCIQLCLQSGFPYAGVQYSAECFCGSDEPPSTARLPDSSCNMKCPADPHKACGGYYTINVYQTGVSKFLAQVPETSTQPETTPVRIVFLLTLNGRAVRQVKRLIKILYHENHFYHIHVDIRQDYLFRELLFLENKFKNVRLTRRRFTTIWGGASLLQMLLASMRELLDANWDWDFVINLSESDYPVKPIPKLVEFLSANKDKNFVKSHGREVQRFIQKQGLDKTFVECDAHMWRTGDRRLPWGVQMDGGSDWVALSKSFVNYVVADNQDELVKGLLVVFKHTLLPAESFFHTVLRNSKFCNTYVDNNLHVTNWKRRLGCKCQYKHVVDWCGCSPNDFKPEDWARIQGTESRQLFFARKFEPIINQAVILQLEQWLFKSYDYKNVVNINNYWQSIYHHADMSPIPDDSLLTVTNSLIRITGKDLSNDKCIFNNFKLIDVTSYHHNDNYNSTLVLYEALLNSESESTKIKLETMMKPKQHLVLLKSDSLIKRLQYLAVSSEYDQKEQILRNFVKVLGPYSEPVLVYKFSASLDISAKAINTNISFLWIDPTGELLDISDAVIDESHSINFVKPILRQPLLPGSWKVKLVVKKQVIAENQFLILPLEFLSGNVLLQNQVFFIHSGSDSFKEFNSTWDKFLLSNPDRDSLGRKAEANSKRFGPDLQEWIDVLFNKFYTVLDTCSDYKMELKMCGLNILPCKLTNWSSLAPDPKSYINKINRTTGSFDLY